MAVIAASRFYAAVTALLGARTGGGSGSVGCYLQREPVSGFLLRGGPEFTLHREPAFIANHRLNLGSHLIHPDRDDWWNEFPVRRDEAKDLVTSDDNCPRIFSDIMIIGLKGKGYIHRRRQRGEIYRRPSSLYLDNCFTEIVSVAENKLVCKCIKLLPCWVHDPT